MTLSELNTALAGTGIAVAYDHFPAEVKQALPCITFQESYTSNILAENKVYKKVTHVDIMLWTGTKDQVNEGKVEQALDNAGLVWEMTAETFEDEAQAYQRIYEVTI